MRDELAIVWDEMLTLAQRRALCALAYFDSVETATAAHARWRALSPSVRSGLITAMKVAGDLAMQLSPALSRGIAR